MNPLLDQIKNHKEILQIVDKFIDDNINSIRSYRDETQGLIWRVKLERFLFGNPWGMGVSQKQYERDIKIHEKNLTDYENKLRQLQSTLRGHGVNVFSIQPLKILLHDHFSDISNWAAEGKNYSTQKPKSELKTKQKGILKEEIQDYKDNSLPSDILARIKKNTSKDHPNDYETQEYVVEEQVKSYKKVQNYRDNSISPDVLEKIKKDAKKDHPNDYSTQEYVIEEQVKAYRNLQKHKDKSIPFDILAKIKKDAAKDHPHDYSTQEYVIDEQVKSYKKVQNYRDNSIPPDVLEKIKKDAKKDHPNDYSTQEYVIEEQVKAYKTLQKQRDTSAPSDVLEKIKKDAAKEYSNDYEMQSYTIKEQIKAFKKLQNYQDKSIPSEILKKIKEHALHESSNGYESALFDIKNQVKAYKKIQKYENKSIPHEAFSEIKEKVTIECQDSYVHQLNRIKSETDWYKRRTNLEEKQQEIFRKNADVFFDRVILYIKDNPGCLQSNLLQSIPKDERDFASFTLWKLDRASLIKRDRGNRKAGTYKLYINGDINRIKDILSDSKMLDKAADYWEYDIPITVNSYSDSKQIISDYFSNKVLKELYQQVNNWKIFFDYRGIPSLDKLNYGDESGKVSYEEFLSALGCCLRFDIGDSLKHIIDEYWTKECTIEFKKFLSKYGFFADAVFITKKLEDIISKEKLIAFYGKVHKEIEAEKFEVKWCGFQMPHQTYTILYGEGLQINHILGRYAQSLKFKWGFKPDMATKKCQICKREFYTNLRPPTIIEEIVKHNLIKDSINEINYCNQHFILESGMRDTRYTNNFITMDLIKKYWDKGCEEKLEELYEYHGKRLWGRIINSSEAIERIMGNDKFNRILEEINIDIKNVVDIVVSYDFYKFAQDVLVKRRKKQYSARDPLYKALFSPYHELLVNRYNISKKCLLCGNQFNPEEVSDNFTLKPMADIKICNECYNKALHREAISKGTKKEILNKLKQLIELIGYIPPSSFPKSTEFIRNIPHEHEVEVIQLLHEVNGATCKKRFGSYFKALVASDILEGSARKTPRGYMCLANDGHECRSLGEKTIDDWLYDHSIEHEKEPIYPGEYNFRGDWKVEEYFIEYWGLKGNEDYDNKIFLKREIAKEHNISLIEVNPDDLNNLNEKFTVLLTKEVIGKGKAIAREVGQQEDEGRKIVQLKKDDRVVPATEKNCIYINCNTTINCKYYKVRHPDKEAQKLIDEIAGGKS